MQWKVAGAVIAASCLVALQAPAVEVDPTLNDYSKSSGIEGNLKSIGSDTLNNLGRKDLEKNIPT